jgi:hypothetical protein
MPTAWETFPVEVKGGLVTNISPLQQGIQQPGSARSLINFEPSIEGGYRRILGYVKFDDSYVPPYGEPLVQGSGQSGTTLVLANIFVSPNSGDILTIAGVDGVYTVDSVSFDSNNKTATLTLEETLDSSPADKASVTFSNTNSLIRGLIYHRQRAVAYRGADIFRSDGSGWQKINKPSYGTVVVNGGSQTGASLVVSGLTGAPQQGDTFTIAGVEKVYTVLSNATVTTGGATLSISPSLDTSPTNGASVTFLTSDRSLGIKYNFARYNFIGSSTIMGVDGLNKPFKFDGNTFKVLDNAPSDVVGARHVVDFKNQIFFAKNNTLTFTAPYTDDNFSIANGAGVILVPHTITGLIVFREQLIVFSTNTIHRLIGNTVSDFQLQPISQDIGCVRENTIQEVGGDVAFLGPDGVRLLSATDRIGDFGLAVASRPIQSQVKVLVESNTNFSSCVVRAKNQYRLFGYSDSRSRESSSGVLATQFADQTAEGMAWAETRGIMSYVADSVYSNLDGREVIIFASRDGYVYRMEAGNSFDGEPIRAFFYTPFWAVTDPRIRKTFYKLTTYLDASGSIEGSVTPRLDFDELGVIQPPPVSFGTQETSDAVYGRAVYGVSRYGSKIKNTLSNSLIGSGFTLSLEYIFESTSPPFSIDALTVEFLNNDRQ